LGEALLGFSIGGILGFALAIIFAHSPLMQRGLLPYVVASQTVPILAIAPMVVIWMRQADLSVLAVPVIAAYLTFFPVTIYTLRGLTSVQPTALELMDSYAATKWQTLIKLRLPNALPQIFTALKISATASVRHPRRTRHSHTELHTVLQPVAAALVGHDCGRRAGRHPVLLRGSDHRARHRALAGE